MKIGFICWKQGGGTSDYGLPEGKSWLKDFFNVEFEKITNK